MAVHRQSMQGSLPPTALHTAASFQCRLPAPFCDRLPRPQTTSSGPGTGWGPSSAWAAPIPHTAQCSAWVSAPRSLSCQAVLSAQHEPPLARERATHPRLASESPDPIGDAHGCKFVLYNCCRYGASKLDGGWLGYSVQLEWGCRLLCARKLGRARRLRASDQSAGQHRHQQTVARPGESARPASHLLPVDARHVATPCCSCQQR